MPRAALAIAGILLALLPGCERGTGKSGSGQAVPAFTARTLDQKPFDLADLKGEVVLLNVWASWCAPCREELPELQRLHREHEGRGLAVIGVTVDKPGSFYRVKDLVNEFSLTYPIVLDPEGKLVGDLKIDAFPTSFLVGKDGRIRWRKSGALRPGDRELAAEIEDALAAETVATVKRAN